MAEALEEAGSGLTATLKDLFSGAVGGVAQVLIGMIFWNWLLAEGVSEHCALSTHSHSSPALHSLTI